MPSDLRSGGAPVERVFRVGNETCEARHWTSRRELADLNSALKRSTRVVLKAAFGVMPRACHHANTRQAERATRGDDENGRASLRRLLVLGCHKHHHKAVMFTQWPDSGAWLGGMFLRNAPLLHSNVPRGILVRGDAGRTRWRGLSGPNFEHIRAATICTSHHEARYM